MWRDIKDNKFPYNAIQLNKPKEKKMVKCVSNLQIIYLIEYKVECDKLIFRIRSIRDYSLTTYNTFFKQLF